jgi:PAS domain S-box-containing protein
MDKKLDYDFFHEVMDNLYEGVVIADAENKVIYVNKAYTRITGVSPEHVLNTDLSVSRPGSRMKSVLTSGKAELGVHRTYGNREHVTNIVPIYKNGKLLGGVSILNSTDDIQEISKILEKNQKEIASLQKRIDKIRFTNFTFDDIIAENSNSLETKELAKKLAKKDISILILGESGTGKEVYAQAIHDASPRKNYPFIAINCSAISPSLIESELFGYVGNSFTGASREGHKGIFEAAEGGTVFLDEIGEMDIHFQAKLLRVLQENTIRPIGSTKEKKINVRIIAATNRDLLQMVYENKFRLDLYYRIAPTILTLLPLKSRPEDIMPMVENMLKKEGEKNKKNLVLSHGAKELLLKYNWPGNIRELTNAISAAAVLCENDTITIEDFPKIIKDYVSLFENETIQPLKKVSQAAEAKAIEEAILKFGNTTEGKKEAAKQLGISVATLYNKLKSIKKFN